MNDVNNLIKEIERLKAENTALKRSHDLRQRAIHATLDVIDAAILIVDTNYHVVAFNKRHETEVELALGKQITIGDPISEILAHMPATRDVTIANWKRVFRGETFSHQTSVHPDDDHSKTLQVYEVTFTPLYDEQGDIYAGCSVTRNITEKRETQEALFLQHARLDTALRNSGIMLFQQDTDLKYTWYYTHDSEHTTNLLNQDDEIWLSSRTEAERLRAIKRRVLRTGKGIQQVIRVRRRNEVFDRYYDTTLDPIYDDHGKIIGLTGAAFDRTEIRNMEKALVAVEMREREMEKEREIIRLREEFLAMMSHDFREPLAAIMTSQSLMQRYIDRLSQAKQIEHLRRIEHQVHVMTEIIEDVMTHYGFELGNQSLRLTSIHMNHFVKTIFEEFQQYNNNQKHQYEFVDETNRDIYLSVDDILIRRAVNNLLSNAVKYSPDGGKVTVSIEHDEPEGVFIIKVSDEGIGIPPQDSDLLFRPFHRASNTSEFRGTGLGLSVVEKVITSHKGRVFCSSTEGVSSTFIIQLPTTLESAPD